MASEAITVKRRADARQALAAAEGRVTDLFGVTVETAPLSREPEIAAIQQVERAADLLTAIADSAASRALAPRSTQRK